MSNCYDQKPPTPRPPIKVAGELAVEGSPLSVEGARAIKQLLDENRKLRFIIDEGLGPRDLERDI